MQYPYSDDFMKFNERTKRYILTEKGLLERAGINLRARITNNTLVSPAVIIENFCRTVSDMIYSYIHKFSGNNARQDCLIANVPELRDIIGRAMEYQAVYVLNVGNLYLSSKKEDRERAIDELAKEILGETVACLGTSILYTGV